MREAGAPLLDRDGELEVLASALESARTGRGCIVVVEGSAGAGKSALLRAGSELASALAIRVISARGGELEQDYPSG